MREMDDVRSSTQLADSEYPEASLSAELNHRLESYRNLLDSARAIVWRADARTFQFSFVSPYAETLLGYPLTEWTSQPTFWKDHIHQEDRDGAVAFCLKATREKRAHELDYRMIAAHGRIVWVRDIVFVVTRDDQPRELVGVMIDVTEKKAAEQRLERSGEHLRQVIDTIPQEIWSGPANGALDFWNERWRTELGLTLPQIQSEGWQQILHPEDRGRVFKAWHESVSTGKPFEQQVRHRMANGEYRWFLVRAVPLRNEQQKIVRWFGTNTDITDQKRAEDELRESEQRWRGVFDNARVGVALQDLSLRYVDANAAFSQLVGYPLDELKKLTCLDITHQDDRERYKATIDELLSGKLSHFELEKRYVRKDGKLVWARLNGSTVCATGAPFWVVMVEDISERKRLADQVQQERDRLRLLLDLNQKFVSRLEVRDFFDVLAIGLSEIDGWEYSFVALPESSSHLKIHLVGPGMGELSVGLSVPIEGTFAGNAYRDRKPEFFRGADLLPVPDHPELTKWRESARACGLQAGWNLPLLYDGELLGVLGFHTRRDPASAKADLAFLEELAKLVAIALHNALRFGELVESREKLSYQKRYIEDQVRREGGFDEIVGTSTALRDVLQQVNAVAPTDSTVLVLGESGTGKELIARAIHDRSLRRDHPFIKVDSGAIPTALMESELFGYEKGAFTGAVAQKLGRIETADQGTLFLDEIGDLPHELQPKLLRVLQEHAFERVGSNRTRHVDIRVIAATNRNLEVMVEDGKFREDLYYRLKVFPIVISPLRERPADIPPLVEYYVKKYARTMKKQIITIPVAAMDVFRRYSWPGNVRELQHFMERSVIVSKGSTLEPPLAELERAIEKRRNEGSDGAGRTLVEIERQSILQALRESNWIVGGPHGAARKLGLKRTTLASRMEKLGISRPM